jgi:hypothetical protein
MSRLNDSGALAMGAVAAAMFSVGVSLAVVACGSQPSETMKTESRTVMAVPMASAVVGVAPSPSASTVLTSNAVAAPGVAAKPVAKLASANSAGLMVKRFVVAAGVRDREPVASEGALPADGKPIYAFAELSNGNAEEAHVRITFERKGSSDQVGNVTLAIPANTSRYRTWGNTRFVREVGTWEAVLWSENGTELVRTSFEVTEG